MPPIIVVVYAAPLHRRDFLAHKRLTTVLRLFFVHDAIIALFAERNKSIALISIVSLSVFISSACLPVFMGIAYEFIFLYSIRLL